MTNLGIRSPGASLTPVWALGISLLFTAVVGCHAGRSPGSPSPAAVTSPAPQVEKRGKDLLVQTSAKGDTAVVTVRQTIQCIDRTQARAQWKDCEEVAVSGAHVALVVDQQHHFLGNTSTEGTAEVPVSFPEGVPPRLPDELEVLVATDEEKPKEARADLAMNSFASFPTWQQEAESAAETIRHRRTELEEKCDGNDDFDACRESLALGVQIAPIVTMDDIYDEPGRWQGKLLVIRNPWVAPRPGQQKFIMTRDRYDVMMPAHEQIFSVFSEHALPDTRKAFDRGRDHGRRYDEVAGYLGKNGVFVAFALGTILETGYMYRKIRVWSAER